MSKPNSAMPDLKPIEEWKIPPKARKKMEVVQSPPKSPKSPKKSKRVFPEPEKTQSPVLSPKELLLRMEIPFIGAQLLPFGHIKLRHFTVVFFPLFCLMQQNHYWPFEPPYLRNLLFDFKTFLQGLSLGTYLTMQKHFEIQQGVPEIWGFKRLEMILLHETKKRKKTTVLGFLC